jgi:hypothetical protein
MLGTAAALVVSGTALLVSGCLLFAALHVVGKALVFARLLGLRGIVHMAELAATFIVSVVLARISPSTVHSGIYLLLFSGMDALRRELPRVVTSF